MPSIAALYVYPVKSCRGISLQRARLTAAGLQHDREWMVVTPEGRFLTQRELPQLAVVATSLDERCLGLTAPGRAPLEVPLRPAPTNVPPREVNVWGEACLARDEGDAAAQWFGEVAGRPVRLVRFDRSKRRPTDPEWSQGLDGESLFSDGFPVLVLSQASLDDLNSRLPSPLPVERFRPNVLLAGCGPYEEDRTGALAVRDVRLRLVKPCSRCSVTTVEQSTGVVQGDEPLRTLKTYRWDARRRGVMFGQNAIVETGDGALLAVGDVLEASAPQTAG